jgi:hypothetical protein
MEWWEVLTKHVNITLKPMSEKWLEARIGHVKAFLFQARDVKLSLEELKENGKCDLVC